MNKTKRSVNRYISELTAMQLMGGRVGNLNPSEYYDVYLTNNGLRYVTENTKDKEQCKTTKVPRLAIRLGRITTLKDLDTYEGSETQRKCREEIQDILLMLDKIGVMD